MGPAQQNVITVTNTGGDSMDGSIGDIQVVGSTESFVFFVILALAVVAIWKRKAIKAWWDNRKK